MLLKEFIQDASAALGRLYPFEEARRIVILLVTDRLGVTPYTHLIDPEFRIDGPSADLLEKDMERLLRYEPIQYVLGYAEFFSRRFRVTEATLIPRPETEVLCREALRYLQRRDRPRVLDLCTGSGCIAWTIAQEKPTAEVFATDISEEALEVARGQGVYGNDPSFSRSQPFAGNAPTFAPSQSFAGNAPTFARSDLLTEDPPFPGLFDLIVCNPPYIAESEKEAMRPNVLSFEPDLALFVPDSDPLMYYRSLAALAASRLAPDGLGLVEINERFPEETAAVFRSSGFSSAEVLPDYFEKPRFLKFKK